ncbi:MAG: 3-deoxy-D-manno-octulosonic acid kinase [Pseudomonadota bacterium]
MEPPVIQQPHGWVILTNPECASDPVGPEQFEPAYWQDRGSLTGQASGRGQVFFVDAGGEGWAVRHYQRGGLIGRFNRDRYLFTGHARVRAVREFELLRQLVRWNLPTAVPVAARYRRQGLTYTADLITRFLPHEQTLAGFLKSQNLDRDELLQYFGRVGRTVATFLKRGVSHADLNCHNVLLSSKRVDIIDLDRGRIVAPGPWRERSLKRLKRSALKVSLPHHHAAIEACWPALRDAALAS